MAGPFIRASRIFDFFPAQQERLLQTRVENIKNVSSPFAFEIEVASSRSQSNRPGFINRYVP